MDEKQIEKLMKSLKCSRAEAIQIIEDDKEIDRGAKLFELDPELEAGAKKARQATRKPNATKTRREKKPKPEKAQIVSTMIESLRADGAERFEVLNEEREFIFYQGETKYKVTLACPRK